ncbi:MAG: PSD1 and planctomycete cytochrome C domain-containing protein [Pirellulaceae bacterium]|nr:PSD1 and planctomycete cytochrome C domain-containing protein [Pirellulaceae bacterium]
MPLARSWLLMPLLSGLGFAAPLLDAAPPEVPPATAEFDPAHAEKMAEGLALFKSQVRGVLSQACIDCHGGDEVQSGFDLATRKGLLRGGSKGPAVIAGKAADSNLVRFISHREQPTMPEGSDKLPADQIAAISRWIDLGAPYDKPLVANPRDPDSWTATVVPEKAREFWSFRPLAKVEPPAVKQEAWIKTPVDRFILARLEEQGLTPNPAAVRRLQIRRAWFDLVGLPPPAEEVEKFVADPDSGAYDKLLDRLLDSPHFGERWARHWLDAARFAESHGFEQDYDRPHAYHFRDFVIRAFNQDLPYDQFVRWQLAGDELAPGEPLALMATGFLGAGVFPTQITANEVERTRYDALDDMAATTGSAMLGLSVGCARCHDHKFDPIPQADYYRLLATFTTTVRANVDVNLEPAAYAKAKGEFDVVHAPFVAAREKYEASELPARLAAWEQTPAAAAAKATKWRILTAAEAKSKGNAILAPQPDGSLLASGTNPDLETYTLHFPLAPGKYTGVRLEALAHASLAKGGPGRATNGNFALTNLQVAFQKVSGAKQDKLKLTNPQSTFEQTPQGLFVKNAIDEDKKSGWAIDPKFGQDHAAVFELAEPLIVAEPGTLVVTLDFQNNKQHAIGRPRVSIATGEHPLPVEIGGLTHAIAEALSTPAAARSAEQWKLALAYFREFDPQWRELKQAEEEHARLAPQPNVAKVMICSEGVTPIRHHTQGADFFAETFFLKRGDCDQKMGQAEQGFLQVLMTAPDRERHWQVTPPAGSKLSYRRTALANWITDAEHGAGHLLARVIVNRLWRHHFGRGIVATPNDFGVQGTRPTHPELLDWLAAELIRGGWKLKPLHKLLMTSGVYVQSGEFDPADARIDPENLWLWRRAPQRLEAEVIRDSLLATSGLLDRTQFGPGTLDEGHKRRSLYFTMKRSKLIPLMQLFDQPEPLVSVGGRPSTTIAPQALAFLNSPLVRESAHGFAARLLAEKTAEESVRQGYLAAVGREPDGTELAAAVAFLASQQRSYEADQKPASRELALADFCQVLFGLNEFVYVE